MSFRRQKKFSPAGIAGIILFVAAVFAFFFNPYAAAAILLFYVVLCLAAAFLPWTNFLCPVISAGCTKKKFVSLTFDDGPTEPLTGKILDLLDKYSVTATFFVTGVQAECHPNLIKEITDRGHSVGNHSWHHDPFLMLRGSKTIYREIVKAQQVLRKLGLNVYAFRPPVGIVNPKLPLFMEKAGMYCITFSCRAFDAGNRRADNISSKILRKVKGDDIILLHDSAPRKGNREIILAEMEKLLAGLAERGFQVVPLSFLIGREIMTKIK